MSGKALAALPPSISLRILSDGLAGHESQTLGISAEMGLVPDIRRVSPRNSSRRSRPSAPSTQVNRPASRQPHRAALAGHRAGGGTPHPAISATPETRIRQAGFHRLRQCAANGLRAADLIVAPIHDGIFGRNVVTPVTPPNRLSPAVLAQARRNPDPRVAALPAPRAALLIAETTGIFASRRGRHRAG